MPDGDERAVALTYSELARVRGISKASAERLVHNRKWRRSKGNDGRVRVMVPPDFIPDISPEIIPEIGADRRRRPGRPAKNQIGPEIGPEIGPDITPDITPEITLDIKGAIEAAVAPLRETIKDLQSRLDGETEERRQVQARLDALLTDQRNAPAEKLPMGNLAPTSAWTRFLRWRRP